MRCCIGDFEKRVGYEARDKFVSIIDRELIRKGTVGRSRGYGPGLMRHQQAIRNNARYGKLRDNFFWSGVILRRRFSINRIGRKVGSTLGVAIAALVVSWVQGWLGSAPATAPGGQRDVEASSSVDTGSFQHPASTTATRGRPPVVSRAVPRGRYTLKGVVSKVADGDTVTLTVNGKSRRVRLDSIDAPEIGHGTQEPGQPFAEAAQQYLDTLVGGRTLTAQCYEKDQFQREVCALILPDGNSANRVMVASGYAWAYTARRGDYLTDIAMRELQEHARHAGLGLWAQGGPTEPWKWRYECWRNQRCATP